MKQLLTVLALAALAACGGNNDAEEVDAGAAITPDATAPVIDPAAGSAPVTDPAAMPAVPADSAAAAGTTAPAAGTDSAPAAPASH